MILVGVSEGLLPFQSESESKQDIDPDILAARLQEERRLMYVGITRAQRSLCVSWSQARKKGRESVAVKPSRFIAEMALEAEKTQEDPRQRLKALRAEFANRIALEQTTPP